MKQVFKTRPNISDNELEALQELAQELLAATAEQLEETVLKGALLEICYDKQT